mmetsp:Transcript_22954/g.37296  ORF Transcript_22954/g.37296 Transcript_22954/m.37296 type:complete len:129 (+) Transcript_22954:515-901(+)
MQHLHWGEGRPTPKPATVGFCLWVPGMRAERACSTVQPASMAHIKRLLTSNEEAEKKLKHGVKMNMHQGIPAKYDIFGTDSAKWDVLNGSDFVSKEQWDPLLCSLRAASLTLAKNKITSKRRRIKDDK